MDLDYPRTLTELEERFSTEDACRDYLARLRWPDGFACPRCEGREAWAADRRRLVCPACGYQASVTAGTIFQSTRKPLVLWFRAVWWVTSQKTGASALGLQRIPGLGQYRTAWSWLHKLRRAMVRPGRDRLDGCVEMDETYVGGEEPGAPGRKLGLKKSLAVIAIERRGEAPGRVRMRRVPNASARSLESFVVDSVAAGSVVRTDGWPGYVGLKKLGYRHERVVTGSDPERLKAVFPGVQRAASLLKRWLLGTHQGAVGRQYLDYYLDEFTFRFNRRKSRSRGCCSVACWSKRCRPVHPRGRRWWKGPARRCPPKNTGRARNSEITHWTQRTWNNPPMGRSYWIQVPIPNHNI